MAKKHVNIDDLNANAAQQLSEEDLRKVTGGLAHRFDALTSMAGSYQFDPVTAGYDVKENKKV